MNLQFQLNGQHSANGHVTEQYPRHTKSPWWHCSINDLDGVNEKELIEKKLRKVGPNWKHFQK